MDLKNSLSEDMKTALKGGNRLRLSTIRLLIAEIKNAEIEKRGDLTEEEIIQVVAREAKKRREAITEFKRAGREDLVQKESGELAVLEEYLPEQMTEDELRRLIEETIEKVGATSPKDIGRVMAELMPRIRGMADGKQANMIAREMLEHV